MHASCCDDERRSNNTFECTATLIGSLFFIFLGEVALDERATPHANTDEWVDHVLTIYPIRGEHDGLQCLAGKSLARNPENVSPGEGQKAGKQATKKHTSELNF